MTDPIASSVTKRYQPRGPLQQVRLAKSTSFQCFRCGQAKTSKLITIYSGDWSRRLCNGCYGSLLAIFDVKAGVTTDDDRADALAAALLAMVPLDDQRQAERRYRAADERAERLSPEALRFVATAEHVASLLEKEPQLEWSPAVIGLCKAIEAETVRHLLLPLVEKVKDTDLGADKKDKDIGRVASYCADPSRKPPELGTIAHFLQTTAHSQERRRTSTLLRCFLDEASRWTGANWILASDGLAASLSALTTNFRNRAAHIDELGSDDYCACRALVVGREGIMWRLLVSVERHR